MHQDASPAFQRFGEHRCGRVASCRGGCSARALGQERFDERIRRPRSRTRPRTTTRPVKTDAESKERQALEAERERQEIEAERERLALEEERKRLAEEQRLAEERERRRLARQRALARQQELARQRALARQRREQAESDAAAEALFNLGVGIPSGYIQHKSGRRGNGMGLGGPPSFGGGSCEQAKQRGAQVLASRGRRAAACARPIAPPCACTRRQDDTWRTAAALRTRCSNTTTRSHRREGESAPPAMNRLRLTPGSCSSFLNRIKPSIRRLRTYSG